MKKLFFIAIATLLAATVQATELKIATGSDGGTYELMGKIIGKSIMKVGKKKGVEFNPVEIINTVGSGENIDMFNDGEVNIAIVQADALNVMAPTVPFKAKTLHTETVFWLYNTKNGLDDLSDMESSKARIVIIGDSGAAYTMDSFAREDSGYANALDNAVIADDIDDAFDMVCEGKFGSKKIGGLLYVSGGISKELREDYKGCVSVGEATDSDFNDAKDVNGDKLYQNCEIKGSSYSPLKGSSNFGKEDTVCVKAMAIYSTEFEKSEFKVVRKGVTKVAGKYR